MSRAHWRILLATLLVAVTSVTLAMLETPEARGASTLPAGF